MAAAGTASGLSDAARRRRTEQLGGAGLRAIANRPGAELRGGRAVVDHRPLGIVVPYLTVELVGLDDRQRRGVTDALGLRVRHSDRGLHRELAPEPLLERVIFDIAEQFRCESLAEPELRGVGHNIAAAFDRWSDTAAGERVAETGVGLLVFTITHMLRYRLLRRASSEAVDDLIETTRGNLARLVGHALRELPRTAGSQRAFAEPASEIARLVAELAADGDESDDEAPEVVARHRLLAAIDWDDLDERLAEVDAVTDGRPSTDDYHVNTTAYDRVRTGASLYRPEVLRRLRAELDRASAAQTVSVARLAHRLQHLFAAPKTDGWSGGHEYGELDPARLARIVASPTDPEIRRIPAERPASDAAVTFLVDTSGSMKLQRYEAAAVLLDTLARALEMAGVTVEVLGFTTGAWNGGRARRDWLAAGSPPDPGRLAEVLHVVYKSAAQTWRQARPSLAAMLRVDHYREGLDGEALAWAGDRLADRPEARRHLVLVSDGWPMEAATANANRDGYLEDHLRAVVARLEGRGGIPGPAPGVQLGAICLDHSLADVFTNAADLDLDGTLTLRSYDVLHRLFADDRVRRR
ncbi:MAG: cobalt chelatase [Actinomycetota bacterium]